jgi:hypothetical protein
MIWPELRAHNIVFALRSYLDIMLHLLQIAFPFNRYLLAVWAMASADIITEYYRKRALVAKDDSTVRGTPWPTGANPYMIAFAHTWYSISQLLATGGVIISTNFFALDLELAFCTLFPIQLSALLMTLVRKSVISPYAWHFYYFLSLVWGYAPIFAREEHVIERLGRLVLVSSFLYLVRLRMRVNKYLFWTIFALLRSSTMYSDYPF